MQPLHILVRVERRIGIITLNRPTCLNAWHREMREEIVRALREFDAASEIGAVIMTGAGDRAFSAGQDLNEAYDFDADRAEAWIREWETYYGVLRGLSKPIVMALNGVAAGSAFQVALLGDIRVGHPGVRMGQPEVNSGIASITGPWIMKEMLGMSRTIELTLTGRLMDAQEAAGVGLLHHVVPPEQVMPKALEIAEALAAKAPIALRLDRAWFAEMTRASFEHAIDAAIRSHRASYASGEPAHKMREFMRERGHGIGNADSSPDAPRGR